MEHCHISVGAKLGGTVSVGGNTWVGIGAVVRNNLKICGGCMIGAGTVVVNDIDEPGTYIGIPAREVNSMSTKQYSVVVIRNSIILEPAACEVAA